MAKKNKAKVRPLTWDVTGQNLENLVSVRGQAAQVLAFLETVFGKGWKPQERYSSELISWDVKGVEVFLRLDTWSAVQGKLALSLEVYTNPRIADITDRYLTVSSVKHFPARVRSFLKESSSALSKALAEIGQVNSAFLQFHAAAEELFE